MARLAIFILLVMAVYSCSLADGCSNNCQPKWHTCERDGNNCYCSGFNLRLS